MANIVTSGSAPSGATYSINISFNVKYELFNQEGNLAYEYNPFHNLRLNKDKEGKVKGELVDFSTNLLNFSLNNPVQIECQPSYDGTVNLILNDDLNPPRIINSRFTCLENNTYKIIERFKNNNTNIYRENPSQFEIDTSLYKKITKLPKLIFDGLEDGGVNKVGNYNFYFKLADSDGNETDFVAESGVVSCYIGNINDPFSIRGGLADESSEKIIKFSLYNIDTAYDYIKIYYTRNYSGADGIRVTKAYKIDRDFLIRDGEAHISLSGYDNQTEVDISEINAQYFIANTVKSQCQCQNRLFLGNISKPEIPYKELRDLALRFVPVVSQDKSIGWVDDKYKDSTQSLNGYEYYNPLNIYNSLGYWNGEIYRFGIVFIMSDFSLSPVFNVRGLKDVSSSISEYTEIPLYKNGSRNYIKYDEYTYLIDGTSSSEVLENVKGVVKIKSENPIINGESNRVNPIGIKFQPLVGSGEDLIEEIKKYAKGFFFVRQKRIPTILAQAITIDLDLTSHLPCIRSKEDDYPFIESFINKSRLLEHDFDDHKNEVLNFKPEAAICPEAELRLPFFNQLFTGAEFTVEEASHQPSQLWTQDNSNTRVYSIPQYSTSSNDETFTGVKIILVEDNTKLVSSTTQKFAARAGDAEEAWRVSYIDREVVNSNATNLVRGSFGTYIGIENYNIENKIINIRISNYDYSQIDKYFNIRYEDESPYSAISERYDITGEIDDAISYTCYRGDCFVNTFTHRINRNFQDPEAPINSTIVDENTWKENYSVDELEKNENINRGDVNAVKLGHWVTFKVCSNINLSLRDVDSSFFNEAGITSRPRAFYPLYAMSVDGESKIPESSIINDGFNNTLSSRYNYIMPNVPYIKNEFDNRILYSDIFVNDAFKNGYRIFKSTNFQDYTREYGSITSLQSFAGNIICIFEHGVALIPVNERVLSGNGSGGDTFINTSNVLPLNPKMLSTNYGTTWIESIIMTPNFIYGVDTVSKKIWRTNEERFEIISDFKLQQYLNNNISLKEREKTPIIGIRNVKSHYNAYKQDVLFTFYDDLYGFEEKVWNLCFNEILGKWITQYSWVPSYSANIDNIFFTFDRNTSKEISKLATGSKSNNYADGIVISNNIIPNSLGKIGVLDIVNRNIPDNPDVKIAKTFVLEKDSSGYWKHFSILNGNELHLISNISEPVYLNIKCEISATTTSSDPSITQYLDSWKKYININYGYFQNTIYLSTDINNLTTDFWKHGKSGIIDIQEELKPCFWYGKQHPFEFEFIVNDTPGIQKIFNNLTLISNKVKPESIHYEIVGDNYDFSKDKPTIYYRQEATKELYQNLGSNIVYNKNYTSTPKYQNKISTLFPWYYERIDTFDNIYDKYQEAQSSYNKDYQNMSGTEIVYNKNLNEYSLLVHSKGLDLKEVGRLRGNMQYKEDKWDIEIRPINYFQKNESTWEVPPIILNNIPKDISKDEITSLDLPDKYDITDIKMPSNGWTSRKEARLRDKYIRIKVRYNGEDKAIISASKTKYTISYA